VPFQAPEVNNIANYISTLPNLKAFIDLRSYGQMCKSFLRTLPPCHSDGIGTVSAPFSYSCKKTPNDAEDQLEAALGAAAALKSVHGTTFVVCTQTIRPSSFSFYCPSRQEVYVLHCTGELNVYVQLVDNSSIFVALLGTSWIGCMLKPESNIPTPLI
jgi:hypothetical protein